MNRLQRLVLTRKRMFIGLLVGLMCALLLPEARSPVTRALVGWNVGVWLYLGLVAHMMILADHGKLKRIAAAHAEDASVVLGVVVVAALMSVGAVVVELSVAKGAVARTALPHLLFALSTVTSSWVLLPTLFTLNYASLYYTLGSGSGLGFPSHDKTFQPDYSDFAYFAFTLAVASQTSDVTVTARSMRKLVIAQSILSFFFNTTILALTINMAAGLF